MAPASAQQMVVSMIIEKQTAFGGSAAKRPSPWWEGLTLDQQDEMLDQIDPQRYAPGQSLAMTVSRWNREKRRVRRARERWIREIRSLRRPCRCDNCRRCGRPPFPKYYVASVISYECWLEEQTIDPELEESLAPLRNDRPRAGAAFERRRDSANQTWNIPCQ
jgi:hypothetical protein